MSKDKVLKQSEKDAGGYGPVPKSKSAEHHQSYPKDAGGGTGAKEKPRRRPRDILKRFSSSSSSSSSSAGATASKSPNLKATSQKTIANNVTKNSEETTASSSLSQKLQTSPTEPSGAVEPVTQSSSELSAEKEPEVSSQGQGKLDTPASASSEPKEEPPPKSDPVDNGIDDNRHELVTTHPAEDEVFVTSDGTGDDHRSAPESPEDTDDKGNPDSAANRAMRRRHFSLSRSGRVKEAKQRISVASAYEVDMDF